LDEQVHVQAPVLALVDTEVALLLQLALSVHVSQQLG
jgi:hypothetical protein